MSKVDNGESAAMPEGMTAEKLRSVADWLDIYDRLAARHVELVNFLADFVAGATWDVLVGEGLVPPVLDGSHEAALRVAKCSEVQNDLRRWADEVEQFGSDAR